MNFANKTSHFNGSFQTQSTEDGDIREEWLFEMVCIMIKVSKDQDWQVHWTGTLHGKGTELGKCKVRRGNSTL